jgi:hypothetical protein
MNTNSSPGPSPQGGEGSKPAKSSEEERWRAPRWMRPYLPLLERVESERSIPVEELLNDCRSIAIYDPVGQDRAQVRAQLRFLTRLHNHGCLPHAPEPGSTR